MRALRAAHVGTPGFVEYVHRLAELGVLDREERLRWVALHGAVLRATEPPLDQGDGVPDGLIEQLIREAGK